MRPYVSISDIKDVFIMVPNTEEDNAEVTEPQLTTQSPETSTVPPTSSAPQETKDEKLPETTGEGAA